MEFVEKWGTDVDTAVDLALDELNVTRDEVEVTVLEEPSRGFFGIGSKLAFVRVSLKKEGKPEKISNSVNKNKVKSSENKETYKKESVKDAKKDITSNQENKNKKVDKTINKIKDFELEESKNECNKDADFEKKATSSIAVIVEGKVPYPEENVAVPFLKDVTEKMGITLEFTPYKANGYIFIDISGKDTGTIIGKRGQTLDSIQYLTNLVINKQDGEYQRVILDAENYRSKREKTLEQLAQRLAKKVLKTKRSQKLEPMNPYERKVIHTALQNNPRVKTRSEGKDPYRRVIVESK
ncbi:RNA-binding cell elongation regulator Jag/EloR [Eubacteriales bacterium KG127]